MDSSYGTQVAFERALAAERRAIHAHERAATMHDDAAATLDEAASAERDWVRWDQLSRQAAAERRLANDDRRRALESRIRLVDEGVDVEVL